MHTSVAVDSSSLPDVKLVSLHNENVYKMRFRLQYTVKQENCSHTLQRFSGSSSSFGSLSVHTTKYGSNVSLYDLSYTSPEQWTGCCGSKTASCRVWWVDVLRPDGVLKSSLSCASFRSEDDRRPTLIRYYGSAWPDTTLALLAVWRMFIQQSLQINLRQHYADPLRWITGWRLILWCLGIQASIPRFLAADEVSSFDVSYMSCEWI